MQSLIPEIRFPFHLRESQLAVGLPAQEEVYCQQQSILPKYQRIAANDTAWKHQPNRIFLDIIVEGVSLKLGYAHAAHEGQ